MTTTICNRSSMTSGCSTRRACSGSSRCAAGIVGRRRSRSGLSEIRPLRTLVARLRSGCPRVRPADAPESGMGGGIGHGCSSAPRPVALPVQPRRPPRVEDTDARPPRLGTHRPLSRRPGRGDLPSRRRRTRARATPAAGARRLLPLLRHATTCTGSGRHRRTTSVSIHLLANDTGCVLRHTFDEETGEARPFRSGYVNADCLDSDPPG